VPVWSDSYLTSNYDQSCYVPVAPPVFQVSFPLWQLPSRFIDDFLPCYFTLWPIYIQGVSSAVFLSEAVVVRCSGACSVSVR
jgi:hypothetical protein